MSYVTVNSGRKEGSKNHLVLREWDWEVEWQKHRLIFYSKGSSPAELKGQCRERIYSKRLYMSLLASGVKLSKVTFQVTSLWALLKIAENSTGDWDFFAFTDDLGRGMVHMENVHLQKNFQMNLQEINLHEWTPTWKYTFDCLLVASSLLILL